MTVTDPTRSPTDTEWPLTRAFARSHPSLRERVLQPEVTVGRSFVSGREDRCTGFGRKFVDLAGGLRTKPIVVETKRDLTSSSLYSAVGQALIKRRLFAADYGVTPRDVEATVLFGDVAFATNEPPAMVGAVADALSAAGISWVVRSSTRDEFVSLTEGRAHGGASE